MCQRPSTCAAAAGSAGGSADTGLPAAGEAVQAVAALVASVCTEYKPASAEQMLQDIDDLLG